MLAVLRASAAFWSLTPFGIFLNAGKGRKSKLVLWITVQFLTVNPWGLCIVY